MEWQPILHAIRHARTVLALGKRVQMYPAAVWPTDLFVNKLIGRLPLGNSRAPVKRHSEEAQTIVNDRVLFNDDWGRRQDLECELRWCNAFEVFGIGEECKNLVTWQRQNCHRFQKLMTFLQGTVPYDPGIVPHSV